MATRIKHTNYMKATVWTPTMRNDMEGSPAGVIGLAFHALVGRPKVRIKLMDELRTLNETFEQYEADTPDCILEK